MAKENFFIGRIAGVELQIAYQSHIGIGITNTQIMELERNAGIYCKNPESIQEYAKQLTQSYDNCSMIAIWEKNGLVYSKTGQSQDWLVDRTSHIPKIIAQRLEPYYGNWVLDHIVKKRILIIHPFVSSLEKQVPKLSNLFSTPWCSDCSFQFISPPITLAGNHQEIDWQVHLQNFLTTIPLNFDIALVAAGGYGMLIADYIFKQGKSVMYVGGALQIFFGVIGKRWFSNPDIIKLINSYWIRPLLSEQPDGFQTVERGCYW